MNPTPRKLVKVRLTIEYDVDVPAHWEKADVEFQRNEGSWCAGNLVEEIQQLADKHGGCLCDVAHFEYIEDEQ